MSRGVDPTPTPGPLGQLVIPTAFNPSGGLQTLAVDADGKPVAKIGQKVRRCSFNSLEFLDDDDVRSSNKQIATVEHPGI